MILKSEALLLIDGYKRQLRNITATVSEFIHIILFVPVFKVSKLIFPAK
jgi:hypothetical protein